MPDKMYQKMYGTLHACWRKQKDVLKDIPDTVKSPTKEAYYQMFNDMTDMIKDMQEAQLQAEAIYMNGPGEIEVPEKLWSSKRWPLLESQAAFRNLKEDKHKK